MKKEIRLPEKSKILWQVRLGTVYFIICTALLILCRLTLWMLIPFIAAAAASFFSVFWHIPRFFSVYRIILNDNSITVKSGVFFKRIYIMPYPRMIYIYTFSTVISDKMGLSAAILKAARGNILTPELLKSDMQLLLKISSGDKNE